MESATSDQADPRTKERNEVDPPTVMTYFKNVKYRSLLPEDIGFEPRLTKDIITLDFVPMIYLSKIGTKGKICVTYKDQITAAEQLAKAGYKVQAFRTSRGGDVLCTRRGDAPRGIGPFEEDHIQSKLLWSIQRKYPDIWKNAWCRGITLAGAMQLSGWSIDDLESPSEGKQ